MSTQELLPEQLEVRRRLDVQFARFERSEPTPAADSVQHGGNHYKQFQYETWNVIADWQLGYFDGNAVKYLSRWRHKGGVEDLKKAAHYIQKLIELETKK